MHTYNRKSFTAMFEAAPGKVFPLHCKGHSFHSSLSLETCMPLQSEYGRAWIRTCTAKALAKHHKDFTYLQTCGENWGGLLGHVTVWRRYLFPWLLSCFALRHLLLLWSCTPLFRHLLLFLSPSWPNDWSNSAFATQKISLIMHGMNSTMHKF